MQQGDRFGSYVLEERLASGGMAEVFRARRVGTAGFSRQVCIKRILPALCREREFVEMFIDEARTGAQLRHGNIVAIEDFGEVDGQFYLCMELVSGVDLARLLAALAHAGRAMPIEVAAHVTAEILRALDYAHRKVGEDGKPLNLVHRDVSPHNVLLSFAGEARLTDFGIAKARTRIHQTTGFVVKGKLAYMPPEQARGQAIDGRADVFALGVTAFEMLAGRRPFVGANETELATRLLKGERPALRALRPDVPPALEAVVNQMLALDRTQRFGSAAEALDALNATGALRRGARALAETLAFCFPEHPSAVRAGSSIAPPPLRAPEAHADAPGAHTAPARGQAWAENNARTVVDPTLLATPPQAKGSLEQAVASTRIGVGALRDAHASVAVPHVNSLEMSTAAPAREHTLALAPGPERDVIGAAAIATRTSLRPAELDANPGAPMLNGPVTEASLAPSAAEAPGATRGETRNSGLAVLAVVSIAGLAVGVIAAAVFFR